ncbi:MAG: hypothetical protein ACKVX7_05270 [Planctomycetota bacterium]
MKTKRGTLAVGVGVVIAAGICGWFLPSIEAELAGQIQAHAQAPAVSPSPAAPSVSGADAWFPADTLLYVELRGQAECEAELANTAMWRLAKEEPRVAVLTKKLEELGALLNDSIDGIEWMKNVQSVLRNGLVVGVLGFEFGEAGPIVEAVALAPVGAERASFLANIDELVVSLFATREEHDAAVVALNIAGSDFKSLTIPHADLPWPLVYGCVDDRFVLGLGMQSIARLMARKIDAAASLAQAPSYRSALARVIPSGAKPLNKIHVNLARLRALILEIAAKEGEPLPVPLAKVFDVTGVARLNALTMSSAVVGNGIKYSLLLGCTPSAAGQVALTVTEEQLAIVPSDSLFVCASRCDVEAMYTRLRGMVDQLVERKQSLQIRNQIGGVEGMLGFEIAPFLKALGTHFTLHEEPELRGWIPGFVATLKPQDAELVGRAIKRLTGFAAMGLAQAEGSAEIRHMMCGDTKVEYLQVIGLPVPIAPAWASVGEQMVFGLSPAAIETLLLRRAEKSARSILDNTDFKRARGILGAGSGSLSYFDTSRVVRTLYPSVIPFLQMGLCMAGRADRSFDASLVPPIRVLEKHLFGDISGCTWTDDGCLWQSHGVIGVPISFAFGVGMAAGLAGPAFVARRQQVEFQEQMAQFEAEQAAHAAEMTETEIARTPEFSLTDFDVQLATLVAEYAETHNGVLPGENPLTGDPAIGWTYRGGQRRATAPGQVLAYRAVAVPADHTLVLYTNLDWYLIPNEEFKAMLETPR